MLVRGPYLQNLGRTSVTVVWRTDAAALCSLAIAPVADDLPRMEALIREARAGGADLVAFPAQAVAESAVDPLRETARQNQITVVFGAKHRAAQFTRFLGG